jgi:UDP-N-acetylglucosamine--N-acetylmuramyl-(pentapeptide) pyrophosphoryl-undecaprenol N-acetylglucosamine transferase
MTGSHRILVSAGGTGGHLFPAEAFANALKRIGVGVVLATDHRVGSLADAFPAEEVVEIAAATPSGGSPARMARAALVLAAGLVQALAALRRLKPAAVVGFGGYPTVPPILAASLLRIPTVLHEQNGVMGRANRFLAKRVSAIATGFPEVGGIPAGAAAQIVHTGNPIRPAVLAAAETPYPEALRGGKLRLLVFGGSQGARVMSDIVPAAVERLPKEVRPLLVVTQQAREEDMLRVMQAYSRTIGQAEVQPFFKDLPRRIAASHLVISRSGASTVAELAAIGRPSILVPLPGALDQDQAANAQSLGAIGAATVIPQAEFTPERLASEILARVEDPSLLTQAAAAAKAAGRSDAAERLAALVLHLARIPIPAEKPTA